MGLFDFMKGSDDVAKKGQTYEITSADEFIKAVSSCKKDGKPTSPDILRSVIKVGDSINCTGKGGGGWPSFQIGKITIHTGFKTRGGPKTYGLKANIK